MKSRYQKQTKWLDSLGSLLMLAVALSCLAPSATAAGRGPKADLVQDEQALRTSITPTVATVAANAAGSANPKIRYTSDGFARSLSAPDGFHFPSGIAAAKGAEASARAFLKRHGRLLGVAGPSVDFNTLKNRAKRGQTFVKMEQTCGGVPVFAGQVIVQLDASMGVQYVVSDVARDADGLELQASKLRPSISATQAESLAAAHVAGGKPAVRLKSQSRRLCIYAPEVLGKAGIPRLTWEIDVFGIDDPSIGERVLLDAHTGEVALRYALVHTSLHREIFDHENIVNGTWSTHRSEGDPLTGIEDVDNAYEFLEYTYNYYWEQFGRDSVDTNGLVLSTHVRVCLPPPESCPFDNAFWNGNTLELNFGEGNATDDIVAHEFTHGVIQAESALAYLDDSGAINESLADVFGEFVDLYVDRGYPVEYDFRDRWLHGEDSPNGANRDMRNPPAHNDPDWLGSELYWTSTNDYGGVHENSGVNNKLCYLITDGGQFRGYIVEGLGVDRVANLYYEANTDLLTSGADWEDLSDDLGQAARNLSWTLAEQNSLTRACQAVGIAVAEDIYVDADSTCIPQVGLPGCGLFGGPFLTLPAAYSAAHSGDQIIFYGGAYLPSPSTPFLLEKNLLLSSTGGVAVIGQ